jgi:NAD(P)-dependent dehydrogenase (short-subunit alcohol dehydrogenase family)
MKIAITGHTTGIGKAIADIYSKNGHEVIGFSRTNGYDISLLKYRQEIINLSKDCDIFFNNAYSGFSQCDLLFELWEQWENQKKTIVNISSSMTLRWQHNRADNKYRSAKKALEASCKYLWNQSQWPYIMLTSPCISNTPKVAHIPGPKLDPDKYAHILYEALNEKACRVQHLQVSLNPKE